MSETLVASMGRPTKQDADLLLKLVELIRSPDIQESRKWFLREFAAPSYEEFKKKYPEGSVEYAHITNLLGFFEIAGVLVTHGLLNEDLFFDTSFGFPQYWRKIGPIITEWQKATTPALWENAVWLANRGEAWAKNVWRPGLKWKLEKR